MSYVLRERISLGVEAYLVVYIKTSAKSEIGFRELTPHTDPSPHAPQIIQWTYLNLLPCFKAFNDMIVLSQHLKNVCSHLR